jgi:hypothetical protein
MQVAMRAISETFFGLTPHHLRDALPAMSTAAANGDGTATGNGSI